MMRVAIRHTTHYAYDPPSSFAVQRLRLTPSSNQAQTIRSWTIEAAGIENAANFVDGFGNVVHSVTITDAHDTLTITAAGEVDTVDTGGILGDLGETAHPHVFLRETPLTKSSAEIDGMVGALPKARMLDRLHLLMEAIAREVKYVTSSTDAATSAAEAFEAKQGVCQDHAHIFIAAARRLSVPARYVTGYLHVDGEAGAVAHHAWAEAHVPDLGWVGFDPANHICPTERYVRLACGLDAPGAAPIGGSRRGGGAETLEVDVTVRQQQQ